jgi:molybdopterin synthase sulfur carrier subunit
MKTITVRYFASLREKMGKSEETIDVEGVSCVAEVWDKVSREPLPANTLVAINQNYVGWRQPVSGGDEVAFFPPVTGG